MADSVVRYTSCAYTDQYDRNGNFSSREEGRGLALKYVITPKSDNTGYTVQVYGHAVFNYYMESSGGPVDFHVKINGVEKLTTRHTTFYMRGNSCSLDDLVANETASAPNTYLNWYDVGSVDIPLSDASGGKISVEGWAQHFTQGCGYDAASVTAANAPYITAHYDSAGNFSYYTFKNDSGSTVALGAWNISSGAVNATFWHKFYAQESAVDIEVPVLVTVPSITNLANSNKYNSQAGVSNSTTSIKVSWSNSSGSAAPTGVEIRYKKSSETSYGSWASLGVVSEKTLSGLSARTTYDIQVRSKNSAGYSATQTITIRTRSDAPTLELSVDSNSLEQIKFKWKSNYGLKSLKYKIGSGSDITVSIVDGATTEYFTVTGLSPNTEYTVTITGVETLDDIGSSTANCIGKTLNKVTLGTISNKTHNISFVVPATKPSYPPSPTISTKLKFVFDGYTIEKNVADGDNSITFTESQWDEIYKRYGVLNYCAVQVQAVTVGTNTYTDAKNIRINLTGIQKTTHVGDSTNKPRRVQMWIGDSTGTIRRAVIWIGDSTNKPRRTI